MITAEEFEYSVLFAEPWTQKFVSVERLRDVPSFLSSKATEEMIGTWLPLAGSLTVG